MAGHAAIGPGWEVRPQALHRDLYPFLECVSEIARELDSLSGPGRRDAATAPLPMVVAAARRISVSIRKVLLDSNGAMVRRCILSPNMHPLVLASNSRPVIFPRHYDAQPVTLKSKYGAAQDVQVTVPAFVHITTIHPLYGIAHV